MFQGFIETLCVLASGCFHSYSQIGFLVYEHLQPLSSAASSSSSSLRWSVQPLRRGRQLTSAASFEHHLYLHLHHWPSICLTRCHLVYWHYIWML